MIEYLYLYIRHTNAVVHILWNSGAAPQDSSFRLRAVRELYTRLFSISYPAVGCRKYYTMVDYYGSAENGWLDWCLFKLFSVGTWITVLIPFGTQKPGESLKITAGTAKTRMVIPNRCRFLGVNIAPYVIILGPIFAGINFVLLCFCTKSTSVKSTCVSPENTEA